MQNVFAEVEANMKLISIYTIERRAQEEAQCDEAMMSAMGQLIGEMQQAGILLDFGGVDSEGTELRVRKSGAQITVTDGPLTEAKEIVGGFAVLSVASRDEALLRTRRFLEVAGDGTSELHQLAEYA
jgi:hypothetical protein